MTDEYLERIKAAVSKALSHLNEEEKYKAYSALYFSTIGAKKNLKKAVASRLNGNKGGRPRLSIDKMKNPKAALYRREARARGKK